MSATTSIRRTVRELLPPSWRIRIRYLLEDNPLIRRQHRELGIIERELAAANGHPWHGFADPPTTAGLIERVVEIPWVLSRYRGERRVLDIGSAYAIPLYIRQLNALRIPELHGVDMSSRPVQGVTMTRADVRHMPYPDAAFDLIICISTLEHIGADNRRYELAASASTEGDLAALREMGRVLALTGRLLITVPFGRLEQHDWFKQYDLPAWTELVARAGLTIHELEVFGLSSRGWTPLDDPRAVAGSYGQGAPAASAVLCAGLIRSGASSA